MALFYKSIISGVLVKAEAASDSSKIRFEDADGVANEASVIDFAAQFKLEDPQPEAFPVKVAEEPVAPKEPKTKANA